MHLPRRRCTLLPISYGMVFFSFFFYAPPILAFGRSAGRSPPSREVKKQRSCPDTILERRHGVFYGNIGVMCAGLI